MQQMAEWPSGQWQQTVNLSTGVYHGSNPCSAINADLAQPAEHIHGKDGVFGSNPKIGSHKKNKSLLVTAGFFCCYFLNLSLVLSSGNCSSISPARVKAIRVKVGPTSS